MQQNSATLIDEIDDKSRYSSMNIPSHGRVPKWLEDMTKLVTFLFFCKVIVKHLENSPT